MSLKADNLTLEQQRNLLPSFEKVNKLEEAALLQLDHIRELRPSLIHHKCGFRKAESEMVGPVDIPAGPLNLNETAHVTFTPADVNQLEYAIDTAHIFKKDKFYFTLVSGQTVVFLTSYAKYLLEYLRTRFPKK